MKVLFNIEKKENGYSIEFECTDIPRLDNDTPDVEEYKKIWDIIRQQASDRVNFLNNVKR